MNEEEYKIDEEKIAIVLLTIIAIILGIILYSREKPRKLDFSDSTYSYQNQ